MSRARFYLRLEPSRPAGEPQRGFAAELADPAWMVGRQWQMGEHQGENASSPLEVRLSLRHVPIEPMMQRPAANPRTVPAEAIVEEGPADWWTIGRRIRLGMAAQRANLISSLGLDAAGDAALRFGDLTGPYASLNGEAYDGRLVHALRPTDPIFAEVPVEDADLWRSDEFVYLGSFPAGGTALAVGGMAQDGPPSVRWSGHEGGDLDWWSVDAIGPLAAASGDPTPEVRWPDRFRWPGSPAARWWQIEDHLVDFGGLPPDRAHLATTMLLDLLCGHSDDWFLFPVPAQAGYVLAVEGLEISDSFGESWPAQGSDWPEASDWSMFQVTGLSARQLPIWPTAVGALSGEPIDEIVVGVDEDANLVWAVEERLGGRLTDRNRPQPEPAAVHDDTQPRPAAARYRYAPVTSLPEHWYPYTREDRPSATRYVQGRLLAVDADGTRREASLPKSTFLTSADGRPHEIAPWRLPPTGVRLETRPMLARAMSGKPVLWVQRRRLPLLSPPASGLRLDALIPTGEDD
jgi:hypothetical protein